jgi:tetratricopeptide (TPR) repeat protein
LKEPAASRVSFHLVSSPFLVAGSLSLLFLLGSLLTEGPAPPGLGPWGRVAALLPLFLMSILMGLDGIQRVEIGAEGIGVASLAGLLLGRLFRSRLLQAGRTFRISWSSVDAVELRVSRFQSPFRRNFPRGWLVAGSPGRIVRVPFNHPCFKASLALLRRCVHPYFVHLPSRDWEGRIPTRQALARMLRTIVYDPATPSEFITETARASLLWGNFSRAERLMDLALAKREGDLQVLDDYYVMMKRLGNLEKARPALQRLIQDRSTPLDLVEMAEVHHAEGEDKEAAERLLQAAAQDQTSDLAHFLLGCLYLQREGLVETALDQWKKGLDRARHPHLLGKLGDTYRYHRELLTTPGFLAREHRRHLHRIWSRRLGAVGIVLVLSGLGLWWFRPESAVPFPGISGSFLFLGGLLMLAAIYLRRRGRS